MDQHLTVSEARKFTGKSDSTIKRLIRDVVLEAQHPERSFILPSHGEVERELLRRRFGVGGQTTDVEESPRQVTGGRERDIVLQVLREQLQSKDDQLRTLEGQLDRKDEQISNWNERMRESNILMKELQQRLSIAAPVAQTSRADVVDASKKGKKPVETRTEKLKSSGQEWTQNRSFLRWFTIR
jgi:hypothetical protein